MRWKIFLMRVVLGVVFAFPLTRYFFPTAGTGTILAIAGLMIFFAYVLETVHKGRG